MLYIGVTDGLLLEMLGDDFGVVIVAHGYVCGLLWAFYWLGVEMDGGGAFVGLRGAFERLLTDALEENEM